MDIWKYLWRNLMGLFLLATKERKGHGCKNLRTIPSHLFLKPPSVALAKIPVSMAVERRILMSVTLDLDEQALASLPLGLGERERHMQIELACRFYASGWLTLGQGARMANLDHYAFGVALAERGIPRQYGLTEAQEDLAHARPQ
jgi:predicted HTH domain antitoxin